MHTPAISLWKKVEKSSWQAFSEQTRTYLATAEQVYTILTEQEEKPDYSLMGMELCKALETEINQRLVSPFIAYLNGNMSEFLKIHQTGETKDRPLYFTYLAFISYGIPFNSVCDFRFKYGVLKKLMPIQQRLETAVLSGTSMERKPRMPQISR